MTPDHAAGVGVADVAELQRAAARGFPAMPAGMESLMEGLLNPAGWTPEDREQILEHLAAIHANTDRLVEVVDQLVSGLTNAKGVVGNLVRKAMADQGAAPGDPQG